MAAWRIMHEILLYAENYVKDILAVKHKQL
jgi:hypothetical protein